MGSPTRRALLQGAAAFAGLAAVRASGLADLMQATPAASSSGRTPANALLVHGA